MEKQKVSTKKRMEISEITGLLRDFANGLDNGKLTLEQDGDILELSIPADVDAKISGRRKEGKEKFSIELSWKPPEENPSIQINPEDQSQSNDNAEKEDEEKKEPVKKEPVKKEPLKKEPVKKEPVKKSLTNPFST